MPESARGLALRRHIVVLAVAVVAVAACSGSSASVSPSAASAPPVASLAASAVASIAPSAAPSSEAPAASSSQVATIASNEPTGVPTAIDPCQLIPAAEASQLAGATFGTGKEEALSGNGKMCVYGGQTKNVFEVIVAVAPDVATAKAEEAAAEKQLEGQAAQTGQTLQVTKMPGFTADSDAVLLEMPPNALGIDGRAIYLLKGATFFGFSDLVVGGKAPTADQMKSEAMTVLGRLP